MLVRFLFALALLGCLGAAPEAMAAPKAPAVQLPDLEIQTDRLSNGLEIIFYEDHSTPIVGVNLWYHVGSGNERPGRTGFAHLFEHMMFQGSGHQDVEYIPAIQKMGGFVNGSTNEDRTNYLEVIPPSHLEQVLLLQADRMGWLLDALTAEKFANQQDVVRNERRESEGEPYGVFWLSFNDNFYPKGHPYDHTVIGAHEDLANASLDDVKEFFRTYYTPSNATLCITGDFDPAQAKQWIEKYFGSIPAGPPVERVETWIPELSGEKRIQMRDRVQLSRVYWCWHTPPRYQDGDADMDLATTIMGGSASSRLEKRLVHEEKLAQSVAFFQVSQQLSSAAVLSVTLRPDASQADVERIVEEELAKFASRGPTAAELERVQNGYAAGFVRQIQRVGGFGGIDDRLNSYNHHVGTPDWLQQDFDRYASRTKNTLRDTFARWIGPNRMVVEVHPFEGGDATVTNVDRTKLPAPGALGSFQLPPTEYKTLASGVKVQLLPHGELPLARVDMIFLSGSARDPLDREGLCDVAGMMYNEGTKKHDKFALQDAFDFLGTDFSVFSDTDRTVFSIECLANRLDESVALLAEVLLQPAFPETEFNDLKTRRLVDIRREGESPDLISAKATRRVLYGDAHPYGKLGGGSLESMEAITLDEVRRFSATHFTPGNAIVVAVGDVTMDAVEASMNKHFQGWSGAAPAAITIPEPAAPRGRTVYLIDKPGDSQSTISIAHLGLPRKDPEWEEAYLANHVLGGTFSGRLNLNLREDKGYTYGVRSSLSERVGRGLMSCTGRVQSEVTAPAVVEFMKELEWAQGKKPYTQVELKDSKDAIVLGYARQFEAVGQLANALQNQIVFGLPDDAFVQYPKQINAVDVATVNQAAKELFHPNDIAIIVIGDLATIEKPVRALKLGPVIRLDRDGRRIDETALSTR